MLLVSTGFSKGTMQAKLIAFSERADCQLSTEYLLGRCAFREANEKNQDY